jgi:UTP--glucose-1-phosphate uridylyltransferase
MTSIKKAVLPVAGMGTRFLPVTKAVPKEMLPILDRPCVEYVVAEAVAAGITELIFVTARGKTALVEYFDRNPALEASLEAAGKSAMLAEIRRVTQLATVVTVRQHEQRGLGHAVRTARAAVGSTPFAVLLPDDIVDHESLGAAPAIGQLAAVHADVGGCVVALKEVPREHTRRYGICAGEWVQGDRMRVDRMVEKPAPEVAPSNFSIVGRYVLPPEIFDILDQTAPGAGGEIQLTDALAVLAGRGEAHGHVFTGRHFDTGNPLGLLDATLHFGSTHAEFGPGVRALLERYSGR